MKKLLIGMAVLVAIFILWRQFKPQATKTGAPANTASEEFSGTLAQAMKLGVPMKCDWQTNEGSGESYVKGEDMYLKTMMSGKTGYMMKKGNCVHTWEEGQKQGIKFCQEAMASSAPQDWQPESGSYQAEGVDWNVEYKCRPSVFAGDRFELPSDVQFTDMAEMMKGFGQ